MSPVVDVSPLMTFNVWPLTTYRRRRSQMRPVPPLDQLRSLAGLETLHTHGWGDGDLMDRSDMVAA